MLITFLIFIIIYIFLYFINILLKNNYEYFNNTINNTDKNVIVVLTRGYNNLEDYNTLINRNKSIYDNYYSKLKDKNLYDFVICHEGNINEEQQKYIQNKTPLLKIIFLKVNFFNDKENIKNDELCPPTDLSKNFSIGYKNMCYFWSISFLNYFKDYNYLIRIDEDCTINNIPIDIIEKYTQNNIYFSSPFFQGEDDKEVIVGMNKLFNDYMTNNNLTILNKNIKCPYTNVMIVNIKYFLNNTNVSNILNEINKSNCIWSNRWGDLPIWGYILSYLIDNKNYLEDKNISYYHGSHSIKVN